MSKLKNNVIFKNPQLRIFTALTFMFVVLWSLSPPEGLSIKGWNLVIIFITTIAAIILKPLPMGAVSVLSITMCVVSKTLTIDQALSGYSSKIVWLVLIAFLLAKGFKKTGLGVRIAYYFVYLLGKNTLGLGYGLLLTDFLLSPFIPSNTARGAGIVFPIASAISKEYGSTPDDGTQNKIGAYLIAVCFHTNVITSAMFVTAMAANPLVTNFAQNFNVTMTWALWAKAAILPGILNLILLPVILYKINTPELKHTPEARNFAKEKLKQMGGLSKSECIMVFTFALLIFLWIFGASIGVDATAAALVGISILLVTGVLSWNDILSEKEGWNTFIWLAALLMITLELSNLGCMKYFSSHISHYLVNWPWELAFIIVGVIYFYAHYVFASSSAHIGAMYVPFLLILISSGAPLELSAFYLAFLSTLSAGITHYGTGTAPVYFGANYISLKNWWKIGAIVGSFSLLIWLVFGSLWWKLIGLW